jgi:hypothetical protein
VQVVELADALDSGVIQLGLQDVCHQYNPLIRRFCCLWTLALVGGFCRELDADSAPIGVQMRNARAVRKEYKYVCQAMKNLVKKGGRLSRKPLPQDERLYGHLATVKNTLEWVHPKLIKTTGKGSRRFVELSSYRHYVNGPTHALLYP